MLIRMTFDASGLPTGFFPEDIFPNQADGSANAGIPAAAVEITDAAYQEFQTNPGARAWRGNAVVPYAPKAVAVAAPQATFTFLQFLNLFTAAEQTLIVASADTAVRLFLLKAAGATFIIMSDPQTVDGFAYLVTAGLLTQARATAIIASPALAAS
jgi:hypothetical protein